MARGPQDLAALPHGILLVDKAPERTSHDVVARVRWLLGTKKVGHAGTLDPMATGLLVLGVGQGTRLLTYLVGLDKTYTATVRLGRATTTDDREGEEIGDVVPADGIDEARIEESLEALRGRIQQVPSTVSAIKVDGKRAYARARAGEDVQLEARPVTIGELRVLERRTDGPFLDLDVTVTCSSGTYVRALARDLGEALGVGGHLTALRRTRVGPFDVESAHHVPARGEGDDVDLPLEGLGEIAARVLPVVDVDEEAATALGQGKRITSPDGERAANGTLAARDPRGALVAVLESQSGTLRPALVIPPQARS
ncbi:tRNA pseudouridine(55) synthase TruB [Brachybacterium endophyticum]|uniref:tRNA pseudouridine synthase B n=1 Tax=Brachybacterium endophyticum TaxID=2182385 RepID=A0A2U2RLS7_9MICO|nr:tRNA pseudouridine(55) synthase TruB [Brachybacterium endophyticum]PWH06745.1 tRNA pseudouridine(55) synthase TruB [Brachybacterium endophyticum]